MSLFRPKMKTSLTKSTDPVRNSLNRLLWRRGLVLIPLLVVFFGFPELVYADCPLRLCDFDNENTAFGFALEFNPTVAIHLPEWSIRIDLRSKRACDWKLLGHEGLKIIELYVGSSKVSVNEGIRIERRFSRWSARESRRRKSPTDGEGRVALVQLALLDCDP